MLCSQGRHRQQLRNVQAATGLRSRASTRVEALVASRHITELSDRDFSSGDFHDRVYVYTSTCA